MEEIYIFPIMMAASVIVMFAVIWLAKWNSSPRANVLSILVVSAVVSVGGMMFAKYGANFGLSWNVYYTVPALITVFLPPVYFRMSLFRAGIYIFLASLSAPAIHYAFLYFLGWDQYMPFLNQWSI